MLIGYARVSTKGQEINGNSLMDQRQLLEQAGCIKIYYESYTGTKTDRPEFNKLLKQISPGDTLVVCKLDRFARTTTQGVNLIRDLLSKGIAVHILNMGLIDNTPTGRLIITILLAFAEYERDMIVERTQAGKSIARTKEGYREGRPPKYTETQIKHAISLLNSHSYKEVERMTKISKSTLIRAQKTG